MTKEYLQKIMDECINCGLCTKACPFLTKYDIDLEGFARRPFLAYHCYNCRDCYLVCPVDLNGYEVSMAHREGNNEGFSFMKWEKSLYKFRNTSNKKTKDLLYFGCNFPRVYPETTEFLIEEGLKRGVDFSIDCCGKPVEESGDTEKYLKNEKHILKLISEKELERFFVVCPNCYYQLLKIKKENEKALENVEIHSIYKMIEEWGIGKISEEEVSLFRPCVDKIDQHLFKDLKKFFPKAKLSFEKINCCGLGGLATGSNPEISEGFIKDLKKLEKEEEIVTYCASCTLHFNKNELTNINHIVPMILDTKEKPKATSFVKILQQKFISRN